MVWGSDGPWDHVGSPGRQHRWTGVNLSSDEHIGLIFGDHNAMVGKTRSTDYDGPPDEPDEPAQDEISKQIRDYSYKFDRRISP